MDSSRPSDYGATDTRLQPLPPHHHRPHVCGIGGPDAPVLLLLWLLMVQVMLPAALVREIQVFLLAIALSAALSVGLTWLSWPHGRAWLLYCAASFVATTLGVVMGLCIRKSGFMEEVTIGGQETSVVRPQLLILCCSCAVGLLVFFVLLSWLPVLGLRRLTLRGSSSSHGESVVLVPQRAPNMQFGFPCDQNTVVVDLLVRDEKHYAERLMCDLLEGDCFWCGEPAFDYVFHMANTHLLWGCFFCHPAHPFEKSKRIFLLVNVVILIVFPVSAFSACFHEDKVRLLLQFFVVTTPRAVIRYFLFKTGTLEASIMLHRCVNREKIRRAKLPRGQEAETQEVYQNEEGMWRHTLTQQELDNMADARLREAIFLVVVSLITAAVSVISVLIIRGHHESLPVLLMENSNGLMFCFYLDYIFDLILPRRNGDGVWCVGFFHHWVVERHLAFLRMSRRSSD